MFSVIFSIFGILFHCKKFYCFKTISIKMDFFNCCFSVMFVVVQVSFLKLNSSKIQANVYFEFFFHQILVLSMGLISRYQNRENIKFWQT